LGFSPFRSPLLGESSLFLTLLRCFSSGGALLRAYGFSTGYHPLPGDGLPHSEIIGSTPGCGSPMLFAAAHVLRRHSTPRHPPHAFVPSSLCPLHANHLFLWSRTRRLCSSLIHLHSGHPLGGDARSSASGRLFAHRAGTVLLVGSCLLPHELGLVVSSLQLLRCKTRLLD
jgi:hypothetical protein